MELFVINEEGELIKISRLNFEENDVYLVDDEEKNTIYIWVGLAVPQSKKDITAEIARKIDKDRGGSAKILIMKQKREYGSFLAMIHDLKKGLIPGKTIVRRPEFIFKTPPTSIKSIGLNGIPQEREIKVEDRIKKWFHQIKEHRKSGVEKLREDITDTIKFVKFEQAPVKKEVKLKTETEEWLKQTKDHRKLEPKKVIEKPEKVIKEIEEEFDLKHQIQEAAYFLSLDGYTYDQLCWLLAEKIQKINLDMPSIEDIRRKAEEVFNSSCTYDELCWLNAEMDILTKKSFLEKKKKTFNY